MLTRNSVPHAVIPAQVLRPQGLSLFSPSTAHCFHKADSGGHFAAWEYPELFAAELRAAFSSFRSS